MEDVAPMRAQSGCGEFPFRLDRTGQDVRATRRACGFTLIEILMVIVILGIAAIAVVPQMSSGADFQATSAARAIAVDLQYAQNQAIATQKRVRVLFDVDANTYFLLYYDPVTDTNTPIRHPINKGSYVVSFSNMRDYPNLKLVAASFGTDPFVEFDAIGAPVSPGGVRVQSGSASYSIVVTAITGKVTVTMDSSVSP